MNCINVCFNFCNGFGVPRQICYTEGIYKKVVFNMSFDMDLCCRRKGIFGLILSAGSRGIKTIKRSDVDSVNIIHICNEILKYVASPKKRLSLYMLAELFYGTVLVYSQQVTNFEQTVVTFFCTIKKPLIILDCDDENKTKKAKIIRLKKLKQPEIIGATQAEQIRVYEQLYERALPNINANVIDSIHITLPDVDIVRVADNIPDLFGDEGQVDEQLAQLCGDNWKNIPDAPVSEIITENLPMNVIPEIAQHPEPTISQNILPPPDKTVQQSKRLVYNPEESPSKRKRIVEHIETEAIGPRPDNQEVEMLPPIRTRRRLRVTRNTVNINVETPTKWKRTRLDRPVVDLETIVRSPAQRAAQANDPKEIIALILADVHHDDSDIISIVRGAQEDISTESVRANLTVADNILGRTIEPIAEQENHIQEILPTQSDRNIMQTDYIAFTPTGLPRLSKILNENEAVNVPDIQHPQFYTSTPKPNEVRFETVITRRNNLLERIRTLFLENGNAAIQLEQLCDVLNRPTISTTFSDLLYFHGKQYIKMENVLGTLELENIYPGEKL